MIPILGRVGEYGWVHTISTGKDLSASYVSATIHYKDPSGTVSDKTCDVVTAADGEFGWTVTDGFFDTAGNWEAQLSVNLGASGVRKLRNPIVFWIGEDGE